MRRRDFLALLSSVPASLPFMAQAQQQTGVLRVGNVGTLSRSMPWLVAFEQRMAELGYRDGQNFVFDFVKVKLSAAEDVEAGLEAGFRETVARKADLLLANGPERQLKAALAASQTTPIVMVAMDYDPIARGYITGLNQPGGRIAGVFVRQVELAVKRLHLLKDAFPEMRSAVVFFDEVSRDQWEAVQRAGVELGLRLTGVELKSPFDCDGALAEAPPEDRKNLYVLTSPHFFADRERQAQFALRNRLTSMFGFREMVEAGGLMSYGVSVTAAFRRAAEIADRIARGAKPGDLPIEQPTKFDFVVNLKTAKALGLDIPPILLAAADEVIE